MGLVYSAIFENVSVSAAQDFFELQPGDDKPVKILAIYLSQISDVGDAAEEILRVELIRGHTTSGSGGTVPTARPIDRNNTVASGTTIEVNNTTIASLGTTHILHADAFNIRTGWQFIPTPEFRPTSSQADTTLVLRLMAAPADAVTMSGTIYWEEG